MTSSVAVLLAALLGLDDPPKPAAPAPSPAPAFRLLVRQFEAGKQPVARGEVVAARGKVYYLESRSNELIILDPAAKVAHLFDIKGNVAAELTYHDLDAGIAAARDDQREAIAAHAQAKSRAERIDAEMRRDQVDPRFESRFENDTLTLTNASIRIEARGEPDADPARSAAVADAVTTLAKLRAFRDPDDLRQLVQLDAITALASGRKLRPVELTYLFRLAGPPEKHRQTYELVAEVSAEELKALDVFDARLAKARVIPFARYRRRIEPETAR